MRNEVEVKVEVEVESRFAMGKVKRETGECNLQGCLRLIGSVRSKLTMLTTYEYVYHVSCVE